MSKKGGQFERKVCPILSDWFSGGKADDWFWRSSTSGGRATTRRKKGKTTTGHYGDIAACCKQAEVLTRLFTIELKSGYSQKTGTINHLLDRPNGCKPQHFEGFVQQALEASEAARTYAWWLIAKRDGREPLIWFPRSAERLLQRHGALQTRPFVRVSLRTMFCFESTDNGGRRTYRDLSIVGMGFQDFLDLTPPSAIRSAYKWFRDEEKETAVR